LLKLIHDHSILFLAIGGGLAIALATLRALSANQSLRKDLSGAIFLLGGYFVLRVGDLLLEGKLPEATERVLDLLWALLFTFGLIRTAVSIGLVFVRLKSRPPRILRDVLDFSLYAAAAAIIFKSELNIDLTGLLATSAILSVVIGLALQETLSNLFAGLSIQLERPFQVGDMVTVGEYTGQVAQITWRATRLENYRHESITLPNSLISKQSVKNYSRGAEPVGVDVFITASYDTPPNKVKRVAVELMKEVPQVLPEPAPSCRTWSYDDSAIRYRVRYWVADFRHADDVLDEFHSRLWYRFRREGIEIPFPQRTLHMRNEAPRRRELEEESLRELLSTVDLLAMLSGDDRERLACELAPRRFGLGERIIEEGEPGHTFYLVADGEVSVRAGKTGVEVTRLKRGQYFGEMSLLTGEPRSATVVAATDALLLEVDRPIFARLFAEHPGLARQLSALLAQRRTQLRAVAEASGGTLDTTPEAGRIFERLRQIFGLSR
jgi:small-conductance mechanosensitive channel